MFGHSSAGKSPSSSGCRCTLLAGYSSISLAGSEKQISFSQQSPEMLKTASERFIHALLLFLGPFLTISRWVPLTIRRNIEHTLGNRVNALTKDPLLNPDSECSLIIS